MVVEDGCNLGLSQTLSCQRLEPTFLTRRSPSSSSRVADGTTSQGGDHDDGADDDDDAGTESRLLSSNLKALSCIKASAAANP